MKALRDPGEPEFVIRLPVDFEDVAEIAEAVSPDDPTDVVLIGLCSSAYQALDSALELHPRGVMALNPVLTFQPPEMLAGATRRDTKAGRAYPEGT